MTRLAMPAARMLDTLESFHDIGYWSFERASNSLHLSDRATVFFGDPAMPVLRSFRDLLRRVDSRDRMRLRRKFLPALREHRSFVMSLRLAPVADKARTVRLSAECRIEDGRITEVWGLIEDVTAYRASKRERRRAQRNEDRLRSAIGAMDDGFALYDKDDRLVICNEPYRNTYRESAPAIVEGARYEDILRYGVARGQYPDAIGREEEWLAECVEAHQSPSPVAFEQVLPNGRWLRGRDAKTPDGGRAGFRVDITEMKSLQRKLAMALFEARSAGQLHTSLLPNLAHEMRTPLNAIIGFSQLVPLATKLESGEEKVREYCADIEQSGRHLIEIIDNFVDVARLGAAVGQDECDTTGLDGVLERAIRLVTFFARKKGKRLEQTGEAGAVTVRGNATKMVQVILNLLSNAVKYSHQGGKVEIRVDESDLRFVKVWVIDDGPGIPADARETLFQRYERLSADRTGIPGSGLGLAIAKEFTEEMGGRIGVTEARDGGAAFWVAFRRDRPLRREQPARRASSASLREAG